MIVQLLIITIGFIIALSYPMGIEPLAFLPINSFNANFAAGAILSLSFLYIFIGVLLVRYFLFSFSMDNPDTYPAPASRGWIHSRNKISFGNFYRYLHYYRLLILIVYATQIYIFHLPLLIKTPSGIVGLGIGDIPLITNLLILAPFLLTLILSYFPFYWVEKFLQKTRNSVTASQKQEIVIPSFSNYLLFQIRTYFLLAIVPLCILILFFDIIYSIPALLNLIAVYPFIEWMLSILILLTIYTMAPFILKYLWVTESLSDGNLRDQLNAICRRAGIKIRDFLVWKVGKRPFANALLIGLFPFNRYVMLSDTVISNLADDEICAVFAHEVGHGKHKHLLILLLFTIAYISVLFFLMEIFSGLTENSVLSASFSLVFILFFWLFIFGQISKRFELQADRFAATITGNPDSFARALGKIAIINGVPFKSSGLSSLTHPSIQKRVDSVQNLNAKMPAINIIMFLLIIFGLAGLIGISYSIVKQIKSLPEKKLILKSSDLALQANELIAEASNNSSRKLSEENKEKINQGISYLLEAIRINPHLSSYYIMLGDAFSLLIGEKSREAFEAYQKAYELEPIDPIYRYKLELKLGYRK